MQTDAPELDPERLADQLAMRGFKGPPGQRDRDETPVVTTLAEALSEFDRKVIGASAPEVPANRKLLSASMIDALVEFKPTTRSKFTERIPQYLRTKIDPSQVYIWTAYSRLSRITCEPALQRFRIDWSA